VLGDLRMDKMRAAPSGLRGGRRLSREGEGEALTGAATRLRATLAALAGGTGAKAMLREAEEEFAAGTDVGERGGSAGRVEREELGAAGAVERFALASSESGAAG